MGARSDSAPIRLTTSSSGAIDTLWNGRPSISWTWKCLAPRYDGGEAVIVAQAFHKGLFVLERRFRYNHSQGVYTLLP